MTPTGEPNDELLEEWVVRVEKRETGRLYFVDRNGNINARLSSAMRFNKDDAYQYAHSIATQHRVFTARAMKFDSPAHNHVKKSD